MRFYTLIDLNGFLLFFLQLTSINDIFYGVSEYFKYFRFLLKFTSKGKGQRFLVKRSEISNNEVIEMNSIVSFAQMDKTVCYSRS